MKYWQFVKKNLVTKILPKPHVSLVIIVFFFWKILLRNFAKKHAILRKTFFLILGITLFYIGT